MKRSGLPFFGFVSPAGGAAARRLAALCLAALVALLALGPAEPGIAAQRGRGDVYLLMVEDPNCPHCLRWNREVGVTYDKTPEGRMAPLVRRRIGDAGLDGFSRVAYTPTFILVKSGREVGRIVGYPGADFFWQLLDALLGKLVPSNGHEMTES